MYPTVVQRLKTVPRVIREALCLPLFAFAIATTMGSIRPVVAQQNPQTCEPPAAGEYLLLVISPTAENQNQLRRVLPNSTKTTVCTYLKDTVTRIGGFSKIDDANRWARFIRDSAGLSAIITTRPPEPTPPQAKFNPQALGSGYAVLVDYFNRPELAKQVQQVVGGDVGFVSYAQRPYLLAVYTTNSRDAYSTLQSLSERGFFAMVVDSRRVMLLRQVVRLE
ncbi:hypothetical protein [Calothrix sp. NIES-3974]|uniref:hypothetical protein n=1 Tax=Calothrix sp. NIES-3974 TaxID=2005462 RepID=UPI000B618EC8|nr:hypothetical protein [Calothrix sp. NIES-3974]BAZ07010.1 hypothetical protein NIES3974_36720 [Calothrix sp. NIES-3974]